MMVRGEVKTGAYFDSVTLMRTAQAIARLAGVLDAAVVMGTPENKSILKSAGLWLDAFESAGDADLLVAVAAESDAAASSALRCAAGELSGTRTRGEAANDDRPISLAGAIERMPAVNLAMISVAGRYAADLAIEALERGLHVMLFSDNVPLEREIELKQFARSRGLLVMGPDCGTAIVNGVPLAFANRVKRGDIGMVAAAGTGLQEISSLISNSGAGISQAIGTGGRDVKQQVGGIMFLEALAALRDDDATRVIVLVSKPPHESVLARIARAADGIGKPVVAAFPGADVDAVAAHGMIPAGTLEEAALLAVALSRHEDIGAVRAALERRDCDIRRQAGEAAAQARPPQKYVRGLFCGGTLSTEAQTIFRERGVRGVYSNVPLAPTAALDDPWQSRCHSLIDLGDDVFTVGRPHPMIDPSLRNRRILEEARDPETALILVDVVLGYGSHPDPAGELCPAIAAASEAAAVACSVTGTREDPQDRLTVECALASAGARVFPCNAAASQFAAQMAVALGGR